ncbi:MAG TPA: helix-turn-helix transcriptional regulator [Polyangiales bacterium]|nr:helix-turn-helix transcriptional regulator [Polyangiales bacterium]
MSPTILLVTDRPAFETVWREALGSSGLVLRAVHPNGLAAELSPGMLLVLDAGSSTYDEDELLTAVGLAKALGLTTAVALPEVGGFTGIEELLEDLCPGLVAKSSTDVSRIASILQRRADRGRANRFEYLTVSPRPNELLALLGDGSAALLTRPVSEEDDNSEVAGITLEGDAQSATLRLGSGRELSIRAAAVVSVAGQTTQSGHNGLDGAGAVDGARLGARLRELRLAAGLTQAELARRTGIHRPNIARVEAGRHTPSLETLARLATAIGVPTTTVLSAK